MRLYDNTIPIIQRKRQSFSGKNVVICQLWYLFNRGYSIMSNNLSRPNAQAEPMTLPLDGCSRANTLAKALDVAPSTIWKWQSEGKLPKPMKLSNNITLWRNADVLAFLNEKAKASGLNPINYATLASDGNHSDFNGVAQ